MPDRSHNPLSPEPSPIEAALAAQISPQRFQLWFPLNARFIWLGTDLVVATRTHQFQEWAQHTFHDAIRAAAATVAGSDIPVRYVTDPDLFATTSAEPGEPLAPATPKSAPAPTNLFGDPPLPAVQPQTPAKPGKPHRSQPGRRWKRFVDFAVGSPNRVAQASARSVVEEPGLGPNPLVLHGPVGTGKTHLLEAMYVALRERWTDARPMYVTAEEFTNRFVQATRFSKTAGFRRQFRECSALLLDDLHFLGTKRATQEEFLHTLDALTSEGRQVVVTTDIHPRLAEELLPELVDRLVGGAVWGLLPPDEPTRLEILKQKVSASRASLPEDVLKMLARNLSGNARELEGAIHKLLHYVKVMNQPMTTSLARDLLGDQFRHTARAVSLQEVDAAVCTIVQLPGQALQSRSRSWAVVHPRMIAVYLARKHTTATYGEIAKYFGFRQHSTALANEKKVRGWIEQNTIQIYGDRRCATADLIQHIERELLR